MGKFSAHFETDPSPETVDLTTTAMKHHPRTPSTFNTAFRRIHSRRERLYNREDPSVIAERLHMTEETPVTPMHPARDRALAHLSLAYAAAGYAQAALCVLVSLVLSAMVFSFARGISADISRKTRERAQNFSVRAAECRLNIAKNGCVLAEGGGVSHPTPALAELCATWVECEVAGRFADQDAVSASVWAETFAETINSFAEKISSTTVVIGLSFAIVLSFLMSSAAFGFMHRRLVDDRLVRRDVSDASPAILQNDSELSGFHAASPLRPRTLTYGDGASK